MVQHVVVHAIEERDMVRRFGGLTLWIAVAVILGVLRFSFVYWNLRD